MFLNSVSAGPGRSVDGWCPRDREMSLLREAGDGKKFP